MSGAWVAKLQDIGLEGGGTLPSGSGEIVGCLTSPPDGLGVPPLRTEDQSFPQRDGVMHYSDWYEPRVITLADAVIAPDNNCDSCPSAREKMAALMEAWSRQCDDTELVIFTDCHGSEPPTGGTGAITGPFGIRGRPRVASNVWVPGRSKSARATLRFDSVDHRLYLLDSIGTPGSGGQCQSLTLRIAGAEYFTLVDGDNPIDYWRFNELPTSPSSVPEAVNQGTPGTNNMIEDISTAASSHWGQPPLAPGLGTCARLNNADTSSTSNTGRTVEMWYKRASVNRPQTSHFVWRRVGQTFTLTSSSDSVAGEGEVVWNSGANLLGQAIEDIIWDGEPHHVVVTAPNPDLRMYIDRNLVMTWAGAGTVAMTTGAFDLNSDTDEFNYFSEFAIYSGALGTTVIQEHFDAGMNPTMDSVEVDGNLCVPVTITLEGPLTNAQIQSGGSFIGYSGVIADGDTVVIDTENGTAVRTNSLGQITDVITRVTGDPFFTLDPGPNDVLFTVSAGSGTAELCWRPAVISA